MKREWSFKNTSLFIISAWLFVFAAIPFCMIIGMSFFLSLDHEWPLTLNHYSALLNPIYLKIIGKSFVLAALTTTLCLILGYPFAWFIARRTGFSKHLLMLLIIIPFWTSSLIRSYALIALIKAKGVINSILLTLGWISEPLPILFTNSAVLLGLVYNLLPFMILPLLTSIERLDERYINAAHDLGANRWITFTRVILPLTLPGILAGSTLVFLPAMTLFYIPDILGGAKSIFIGNLIQNHFLVTHNWPLGSALSVLLTALLLLLLVIHRSLARTPQEKERA